MLFSLVTNILCIHLFEDVRSYVDGNLMFEWVCDMDDNDVVDLSSEFLFTFDPFPPWRGALLMRFWYKRKASMRFPSLLGCLDAWLQIVLLHYSAIPCFVISLYIETDNVLHPAPTSPPSKHSSPPACYRCTAPDGSRPRSFPHLESCCAP